MLNNKMKKEKGLQDFVLLDQIAEGPFMSNLQTRYEDETIYTFIGGVVVSVNPYKMLPIYTNEVIETYRSRYIYELPPHVYAVAADAHRDMSGHKRDQCIIISGESGAGKTEASKQIMQYIAVVAGNKKKDVDRVKDQLLKSNPVLEAFGNACTNRNDNSSRFGKYMDIQFDHRGDPVGGNITNYLLEKSRVVHQGKGERNFHIFYQLFNEGLLKGTPDDYFYLKQGGATKVKTINDADDFKTVKSAMKVIGFSDAEVSNLFKLVASVAQLGNVNFSQQGDRAKVTNPDVLAEAARLMGSDEKTLTAGLLERTVATNRETVKSFSNEEQALYARDAFGKALYERLFSWLVQRINQSIRFKTGYGEDITVIGVLDIYGFEIFEFNSFEQFCINYCNEKLQQLFIELTLKTEQEEYRREGIQWEDVQYFDNAVICSMIDAPQKGVIAILDEECMRPGKTSDTTFLEKLNEVFKEHKHYESSETNRKDKSLDRDVFRIKHYAGDVTYKVLNFLDKNTDSLFKDLKSVAFQSSNPIAKEIFPDGESINEAAKRPVTAGTSFKGSLADLVTNLLTKNPHYVRCIKPNSKKSPGLFDKELCLHQVRYLGLLENVRVRRAGFAYRQTFELWLDRYRMLAKPTWPRYKGAAKDGVEILCKALNLGPNDYRLGKTKVFIRSPNTLFKFEEEREKSFGRMASTVQKIWRGYKARKMWARLRATIKIQLKWKNYKSKKYHQLLFAKFKDVKKMPNYGKEVAYPPHPSVLERFAALVKKIHRNWWAKMVVQSLTKEQQVIMRRKILTSSIFKGKKPWPISDPIYGNRLSTDPVHSAKFGPAAQRTLNVGTDSSFIFSAQVLKVNRKGKGQPRAVAIAQKHIYRLDPKAFKLTKPPIPLSNVAGVHLTSKKDHTVVIHLKDNNSLVVDFSLDQGSREVEFAIELFQQAKAQGNKIEIKFADSIPLKVLGQDKTLTVTHAPNVKELSFQARGNNWQGMYPGAI